MSLGRKQDFKMLKELKNKLYKLIMWCKGYRAISHTPKHTPKITKDTKNGYRCIRR